MSTEHTAAIELQSYLRGVNYPCSKDELIATAVRAGAPADLLHRLHAIPVSGVSNPLEVAQHISRMNGGRVD